MKLTLVRHGESYFSSKGLCQGQSSTRLTSLGNAQAERVAYRLRDDHYDSAYVSDLPRALETAKRIFGQRIRPRFIQDPQLREIALGVYEGKPWQEAIDAQESSGLSEFKWKPEGGENKIDVWNRATLFYEELRKTSQDKSVLIVGHGLPFSFMLAYLTEAPIQNSHRYIPKNTGVYVFDVNERRDLHFLVENCTKHLDDLVDKKN